MTHKRGLTLIELLVVVAIIAILAGIAIPNLLEAQTRARVSRAHAELRTMKLGLTSFRVDHNRIFPDSNDTNSPFQGLTFELENPGVTPDVTFLHPSLSQFYTFRALRPLTTPIAYLSSVPRDPFSRVMPYGYDTREVDGLIAYAVVFSTGPDRIAGHWHRGHTGVGTAIPYDPTNGTVSDGEIWRALELANPTLFRREYGLQND